MKSQFEFAGRCSADFHLTIEKLPTIKAPARKYKTVSVAGRNGDLHIFENAYDNFTRSYECWFRHPEAATPELAHEIKAWLLSSGGDQVLQDTYDPQHYHLATYVDQMDIEHLLGRFGKCTIQFDCAPQAFLKRGKFPIEFQNAGALCNPTAFTALPLIQVYGTGSGTLTIDGTVVEIHTVDGYLILDSDTQNAYTLSDTGVAVNRNSSIYAPQFPELAPGSNEIAFGGDIERIEIIPRWWEL